MKMDVNNFFDFFSKSTPSIREKEVSNADSLITAEREKNLSVETEDSRGFFANYWSDIKVGVVQTYQSQAAAVITSISSCVLRFDPEEIEEQKESNRESLYKIFGSDNLNSFLTAIIPVMVEKSIPLIEQLEDSSVKKYLLNSFKSGNVVDKLLEVLIPQMIINLCSIEKEQTTGNQPLLNIIPLFTNVVLAHIETIDAKIEKEISLLQVPSMATTKVQMREMLLENRKIEIGEIFSPLSENLLALAFPKGAKEMPICAGANHIVWNMVQDFSSQFLFHIYWTAKEFNIDRERKRLRDMPHGEFYDCLCDVISSVAEISGMEILGASSEFIASDLVDTLDIFKGDENELKDWIGALIYDFSTMEGIPIELLKLMIRKNVPAAVSQLFLRTLATNEEGETVLSQIIDHFFEYIEKNKVALDKLSLVSLSAIERNQLLMAHFKPLTNFIYENISDKQPSINEATYFQKMLEKRFKSQILRILATFYESYKRVQKEHDDCCDKIKNHLGQDGFSSIQNFCDNIINKLLEKSSEIAVQENEEIATVFYSIATAELKKWGIDGAHQILPYIQEEQPLLLELLKSEIVNANFETSLPVKNLIRLYLLKAFANRVDLEQDPVRFETKVQHDLNGTIRLIEIILCHFDKVNKGISDIYNDADTFENVKKNLMSPLHFSKEQLDLLHPFQRSLEDSKKIANELTDVFESNGNIEEIRAPLMAARAGYKLALSKINSLKKQAITPLAEKVFDLINFGQFTILKPFAGLSSFFKTNVIPELLIGSFNLLLEPKQIHKTLLDFLKEMNAFADLEDKQETSPVLEVRDVGDEAHERLVAACRELLSKVAEIPNYNLHIKVLKSEFIINFASRYAAEYIRKKLSVTSLEGLTFVQELFAIHPFDSIEQAPIEAEITAESIIAECIEERHIEEEIQQEFVKLMSASAPKVLFHFVAETFQKVSQRIDCSIEENIGQIAIKIKRCIDVFFQIFFLKGIVPLMVGMLYPIYSRAVKNHIDHASVKLVRAVDLSFNENLIFDIFNLALDHASQNSSN